MRLALGWSTSARTVGLSLYDHSSSSRLARDFHMAAGDDGGGVGQISRAKARVCMAS